MTEKIVFLLLSAISFALTLLFGAISLQRWRLPYNEEGNYFDAANSVVYHEGSAEIFAMMAILSVVAALLFSWRAFRAWRPRTDY